MDGRKETASRIVQRCQSDDLMCKNCNNGEKSSYHSGDGSASTAPFSTRWWTEVELCSRLKQMIAEKHK